jgi:hypothetical protein
MKKYLVVAMLSFILGCFASSPKVAMNIVSTAGSIKSNVELELTKLENEIKLISESYKVETIKAEIKNEKSTGSDIKVMEAGLGDIFGCTPSKPKEPKKPQMTPEQPVKVTPEQPVKVTSPAKATAEVVKPRIIGVRAVQNLVAGRMMLTKINVKLNKEGLNKVKKGARVRIFIDYCYYESGKIESDGTVGFDIGWHPPLKPVDGKVGISLFMQTNNPEIGSGIQYTSIIINT